MERAALVRSLSLTSSRYLSRFSVLFPFTPSRFSPPPPPFLRRHSTSTRLRLTSSYFPNRNRNHFSTRASLISSPVARGLGFEKISDEFIPECKSKAVMLRHVKTGAQVMSVSNQDEKKVRLSSSLSYTNQFKCQQFNKCRSTLPGVILCANRKLRPDEFVWKRNQSTQNVDFPPKLPKKKKKPFPIPFKEIKQAAKMDKKLASKGIEKPLEPPKNGLLVPDLVPVAYEVFDAWKLLIKGLSQLLHVIPVYGCSECSEVHVAQTGHFILDCEGRTSSTRHSSHAWVKGSVNDILVPIESYHLFDPFGKRIMHDTRFEYDRIPAVVELCIQAGMDIPEYPSRRRTNPIRMVGRRVLDRGGHLEEPEPFHFAESSSIMDFDTYRASERFPHPPLSDVPKIAQETINAYQIVRKGVRKLMKKYTVKACGYCSEVHVGPWGHNAKLCGSFKHQWRDGKHGWQDATIDEVLPPNYVWHVRDTNGPPIMAALKRYYGKAPAVVEVCVQAGARIPDEYRPMMRLDIVIPDSDETGMIA